MFRVIVVVFVVVLCTLNVRAEPTLEDIGSLPLISKMALSPNGKLAAFRRFGGDKDLLVIFSLDKNKVIHAVDVSDITPRSIEFLSNDKLVVKVAEYRYLLDYRDQQEVSAAFVIDVHSGSLQQLMRAGDNTYAGQTNVGRILGVSKDKKYAYMPAFVDVNRKKAADMSANFSAPINYAIMKVELASPNSPRRVHRGHKDAIDFFMDANGRPIVQERYNDTSNRHEVLVKRGSKWHRVYDEKVKVKHKDIIGLTPGRDSIVVGGYDGETRRRHISLISIKDGKVTDSDINRSDTDIEQVLTDVNRIVYGVRYSGFTPDYKFFDHELDSFIQRIRAKFGENSVYPVSWSDDWKKVVVRVEGSAYVGDFYVFDRNLKSLFIGSSRPNIKTEDIHPVAKVTIKARDNMPIPMLLTIPKKSVSNMKNLPAVMLPHGGPEAYDTIGYDWLAQSIANEGYMVIQPQFRGSSGFGYDHVKAGHGEWGGKMLADISDGLSFLVEKGMVDSNRVCIVGASYGGYAALASGAFNLGEYKCIVSINGISNMIDFFKDDKSSYGRNSSVLSYFNRFVLGDSTKNRRSRLLALSPYKYAEQFTAPVLLIHAKNDERVDVEQSKLMYRKLKGADKPVLLKVLSGENHYLESNETRLEAITATVTFLNAALKN